MPLEAGLPTYADILSPLPAGLINSFFYGGYTCTSRLETNSTRPEPPNETTAEQLENVNAQARRGRPETAEVGKHDLEWRLVTTLSAGDG